MAATIAHDLKNPLITILGFARRLQLGKGDPRAGVQTIVDSAIKMEEIITDVLNFAKPIHLETKEEDLREILEQAVAWCKTKAEASRISLYSEFPAEPVINSVDGSRLQRALINLIANAIEASQEGQEIRLTLQKNEENLLIRVQDQGEGMDRETLENIFIPFFSKKTHGTGLRMGITKKVIDAHQGKISIESQPNWGTEILIELPSRNKNA